jgi:zinc protease
VPPATTLILAGDVTVELAVQLAEESLGAWSGITPAVRKVDDEVRADAARINVVHKTHAPQSELRIGHRGVPRTHPDYFHIVVMNAILGGLFSSRINLNLRERHAYTYGAHSLFDWRRQAGPFVVSTAVKSDVTEAAAREVLAEISQLRNQTVSAEELSLAVAYLDGVFPLRYETTEKVADAIAMGIVYALGDDYYSRYRERIRAVTIDDVRRAAEMHLHPDELTIVAVGDAETISEPLGRIWPGEELQIHGASDVP